MKRRGLQTYSNESVVALRLFLGRVALADKRARYLDLIDRPRARRTFLDAIHHELVSHLDPAKRIDALSPEMLRMPGYQFSYHGGQFGEPVNALVTIVSSSDVSFLAVSTDGRVGIHGPESYINRRSFYVA